MFTLRPLVVLLALVVGLLFSGCGHAAKPKRPSGPGVGGTVMYITNVQLPPDAVFELKLVELTRDGRADRVVVEENYARPATMPLEFFLRYERGAINKRLSYGMEARIIAGGKVFFATTRPVPVLTRGNPPNTEIIVVPVR